jgi:hypothetical protein
LRLVKEHVNVTDAILKDPSSPFHLIEEKLTLQAPGNKKGWSPVVEGATVIFPELTSNLRMYG